MGYAVANLDEDEKDSIVITDAIGRQHETLIVSEPGFYNLSTVLTLGALELLFLWGAVSRHPNTQATFMVFPENDWTNARHGARSGLHQDYRKAGAPAGGVSR
jgi:hypothetical protein